MAIVNIFTCGWTNVSDLPDEAKIYSEPCDFILAIETKDETKCYRIQADPHGDLIISHTQIEKMELDLKNGYPALKIIGRK